MVHEHVYMHVEVREGHMMFPSVALHLILLRQGLL